tara:strand:+ start:5436 stop:6635 length:1200 start_codon:yes stop_codon:yes gene_type:complete
MKIAKNKLIYILASLDLLVVLTEVKIYFPFVNMVFIILLVPLLISHVNWNRLITSKSFILFFICYFILILFAIIGHGPSIYQYLYRFTRLIPLFVAGIVISKNIRYINGIILFSALGIFLGGISLILQSDQFIVRDTMMDVSDYLRSPYRYVPPVFVSVLTVYLISCTEKKHLKFFLIFLTIFNLINVVRSGFTTPIFILFVCMTAYLIRKILIVKSNLLSYLLKALMPIALIYIAFITLITVLPTSATSVRLTNLFNLLFLADSSVDLNYTSGNRMDLLMISLDTFSKNPFIGVGAESLSGNENRVGSHSSLFDLLAQFGVFGFLFILMFLSWIFIHFKHSLKSDSYTNLNIAFFCLWVGYFVGCIANPYFLSAAIDHYIFVFAGITVGLNNNYKYEY